MYGCLKRLRSNAVRAARAINGTKKRKPLSHFMSTETSKPDAWELFQQEMEKVSALRGAHPELFTHTNVSFSFFPGLERPSVGFHADRGILYAFARKHQEAGWI